MVKESQQVFASSSGRLPFMKARDSETEESIETGKSPTDELNTALLEHCSEVKTKHSPLNDTAQIFHADGVQSCELNVSASDSQDVTVDDKSDIQDFHPSDDDASNPFNNLLLFSDSENDNPSTSKATKRKGCKIKSKQKPKKPERKIPDSFIAVRFSSPEVKAKIQLAQQSMVESDKKLKPTLISLAKLHVTLLTLQLSNEILIDKYVHIMA